MKKKWLVAALAAVACAIVLAGCKDISEPEPIAVECVTLDKTTLTLAIGESGWLTATVTPWSADYRTITWSSSDDYIVMVNSNGMVMALREGTATITAQAGGKIATCVVTVPSRTVAVESITLDETTLVLEPGDRRILITTITPDNASDKYVTWSSSNPEVVTVQSNGYIIAQGVGTATIYAQAGGRMATCEVTVSAQAIAVESITLNADTLRIGPGKTRKLTATVTPYNAGDKTVTWSSSDTDVATVDDDGTITAHKEGTATITARVDYMEATCVVTVSPILIPVESISLNEYSITLARGKTEKLILTVFPENTDDRTVLWSSSYTSVATVDNDGTITALKSGWTYITAQAGDRTAECTVYVNVPVESITLNATTLTLAKGTSGRLTATVTPSDADDTYVTWSSSNMSVVWLSDVATDIVEVNAASVGTATITAATYWGEVTATCEVTVKPILVESVTLNKEKLALAPDETRRLVATVTPSNAEDKTVIWSSSDTSVVTVDDDGTITAHKIGTATITAQAGGKTATCVITVHNHTYSGGKCTVCGAKPYLEGGTIDDNGVLTKYSGNAETVVIPDGVTGIGKDVIGIGASVFENCSGLKSVTIPSSVTKIGNYAFYRCTNLKTVTYDGTLAQWCSVSGKLDLMKAESVKLADGTDLKTAETLVIPDGVTEISTETFYECKNLTSVTIPSSVTSIGHDAFYGCTSLKSVTIPDGVTIIGSGIFHGCASLTSVTIPASVTKIESQMFFGCTSLASLTIPASVTKILEAAFYGCTSLTSIVYDGTSNEWGKMYIHAGSGLSGKTIKGKDITWIAN